MDTIKILKTWLRKSEPALVVGFFDAAKVLIFCLLAWLCLGPLMDFSSAFIHTNQNLNYSSTDISTVDGLYNFYKWIPLVAVGVVVYYLWNRSNLQ